MSTNTLPQAKSIGAQGSFADKVWDALLKLSVTIAIALCGWAITVESRLTKSESTAAQQAKDIARLEAVHNDVLRKMDLILEGVNSIGNRITRLETKLENR